MLFDLINFVMLFVVCSVGANRYDLYVLMDKHCKVADNKLT